ncbi:MAG: flagellar motor protein MotB [Pseudomonadota bacterium]
MAQGNGGGGLVIKRPKKVVDGEHHSSAWKVAYADFATAMMAFFLLLWLLNATSDEQRQGLADYFDPAIPLSPVSGGGDGMLGGSDPLTAERLAGNAPEGTRADPRDVDPGRNRGPEASSAPGIVRPGLAPERAAGPQPGVPRQGGPGRADGSAPQMPEGEEAMAGARSALESALESAADAPATAGEHLALSLEEDGLVIEIVDIAGEPLFASASATPEPVLVDLLRLVAEVLGDTANPLEVIGHTDARPFEAGGYTNWELSADRANAARRLLVAAGLPAGRFTGVIGRADSEPRGDDPFADENRRIAIKLLTMRP